MPRCGQTILLTAALILIVVGLRVPLLPIPLERDEGEYAYIAWRLGHNELPYRDWVDQKPPAVFYVYRFALSLPFDACSRDSLCWVAILGRICLRAFFSRTPIHGSLLGLAGGSAFCAPQLRSIGARNRGQYGALYVVSVHPFTNCVSRRRSENQAPCFVYGACWRFDRDRGDVQAGSGRKLVLAGCSLSSFRTPREAMARDSFIHRLVRHGPANRVGVGRTLLLEAWWINRVCR